MPQKAAMLMAQRIVRDARDDRKPYERYAERKFPHVIDATIPWDRYAH